jgi:hypothetical protein
MRPSLLWTESPAGLSRRVPRAVLVLAAVVMLAAGLARGQTPATIYHATGPFCGKSKRLSTELVEAGYTQVRRYQLGIPVWRALGGLTEIELEGLCYVLAGDRTACSSTLATRTSLTRRPSQVPEIYHKGA